MLAAAKHSGLEFDEGCREKDNAPRKEKGKREKPTHLHILLQQGVLQVLLL